MGKVQILEHPLLQHKLSILRDVNTGVKEFPRGCRRDRRADVL